MAGVNRSDNNRLDCAPTNADSNEFHMLLQRCLDLCTIGASSTNAAMGSWLHLTVAAVSLHTSTLHSNDDSKAMMRHSFIQSITLSDRKCKDLLRMDIDCFQKLLDIITDRSRITYPTRSTVEEQLVAFLLIVGHNVRNRVVSFILCRSSETISRFFHNMLLSIITLEELYVLPSTGEEVQPCILNSSRFYPYFKDCLGAIDGTHVRVKVSKDDAPRYRGRKDWPTQNVLAACTFDQKFTFILAGWEGSAADSRILHNALTRDEPLVIPNGKFYLGDAGFGLTSKVLTPYGRTRYHIKEFSHHAPETKEELFNLRHSSLRNAIERTFGIWKKRFPIIASGSECQYSSATMSHIILACGVLHNFLLREESDEISSDYVRSIEEDTLNPEIQVQSSRENHSGIEYMRGRELRDQIANDMWTSYCASL